MQGNVIFEKFKGPKYQENVDIRLGDRTIRLGQVLEVDGEKVVVQDVSSILSSEDHSELMQSIAHKTSSQFFHLPSARYKSSVKTRDEHSPNGEIDVQKSFLHNIKRSSEDPTLFLYTSRTTDKPNGVCSYT